MENYNDFLTWERTCNDTVDLKKTYIDLTGDLISGLLLSQIIYWNLPDKHGKSKLRVHKKDKYWLAKQRTDWWDEIRITPKQYDRAIKELEKLGIVEVWNTMFSGKRTPHIHFKFEHFLELLNQQLQSKESPRFLPLGKTDIDLSVIPITETTAKNTEKDNKGFLPDGEKTHAFSFNSFCERYPEEIDNPDIIPAVEYYLTAYKEYMGDDHPNLKFEQWQRVVNRIMYIDNGFQTLDVDLGNIEDMINKHFVTEYNNCDYNILHYISGDIAKNRYYEECY